MKFVSFGVSLTTTALLILASTGCCAEPSAKSTLPAAPSHRCWKLHWNDEFDGNAANTSKWIIADNQVRPTGTGIWTASHVQVRNGMLHFLVSRNADGMLVTGGIQSRLDVIYGYFVLRAKLPKIPGYRPGFWLSSNIISRVNDPSHPTEIDILEQPTREGRIHQNLHWNGYRADHNTVGQIPSATLNLDQFHTYGMEWSPGYYRFFIDGEMTWESTGGGISTGPEFIRLGNEPLDARYLNAPQPSDQKLRSASNFQIDYVRVYRLQGCP